MKSDEMLLAIDPGSNSLGWAVFSNGVLFRAGSIKTAITKNRLRRFEMIIEGLENLFKAYPYCRAVVIEDPFLRGSGNNTMEKIKGSIESLFFLLGAKPRSLVDRVHYIPPTTLKKYFGSGDLDKKQMAVKARSHLSTPAEKKLLNEFIKIEDFDATDTICLGLCFLEK